LTEIVVFPEEAGELPVSVRGGVDLGSELSEPSFEFGVLVTKCVNEVVEAFALGRDRDDEFGARSELVERHRGVVSQQPAVAKLDRGAWLFATLSITLLGC
jgi:hypothetical protein